MDELKLQNLDRLLKVLDPSHMTDEDFVAAFDEVLKVFVEMKAAIEADRADIQSIFGNLSQDLTQRNTAELTNVKRDVLAQLKTTIGDLQRAVDAKLQTVDDKLATVESGKDADEEQIVQAVISQLNLPEQKDIILDGGPEIIAKINDLATDDDDLKIDAKHIKGIEKLVSTTKTVVNAGTVGRDIIKNYDLSPLLDGTTKIFAIPANWTILEVSGTSFPYRFNRLVDYTFTPQQITFTSQITAAASLAAGQTVEILYVSN